MTPRGAGSFPTPQERVAATATGSSLSLWAKAIPDLVAISSPSGERTFAELDANICRVARALRRRGLLAGDPVAVVLSNRPEFAEVIHACLRIGLRYTPVNRHLTAGEIAYIVSDCGAKALIGDAALGELMVEAAAGSTGPAVRWAVGGEVAGFERYEEVIGAENGDDLDDPVLGNRMLYTSGTTGRPKGVLRPPLYSTGLNALTDAPRYEAASGQLNLCTGPLYHGGPLVYSLLMPLSCGVGVVLMERWDAATALELIHHHRITHTHMVPTMFYRLLRLPEEARRAADVSSMQYIVHGAAPCTVEAKRAMIDWFGPILWEYFAATEGAGSSISPEEWLERPGSVGRPPTDDHVVIRGADGAECPAGVAGRIHIKRVAGADFEYFNDPAKTEAARRGDSFSVGDIGYLDSDGYLFVTDRDADVIVSGGVNIYPAEVETVLLTHPAVYDVAVIGVPNEDFGEEVKAVFEVASGVEVGPQLVDDLVAHCRDRLAKFKCPRTIDVIDRLPRHDNGKLYRNELRDRYRHPPTHRRVDAVTDHLQFPANAARVDPIGPADAAP